MKNKILTIITLSSILLGGCSKEFLEEKKSYDKYDESIFTNETQTNWYIDRLYNYFFVSYRNPQQSIVGLYDASRSQMTEELAGTIPDKINSTKSLLLATEGDTYYGNTIGTGVQNNPYSRIRLANFLIEKVESVGRGKLSDEYIKRAKGQMYFLRALQYFDLVRIYGGVPIVTTIENASSTDETIRLPRAKSSEVFAQVAKDLDSAANNLPMIWDVPGTNYGRLTAAGALAMKSRVLLVAASPLYNKDWDNSGNEKWQKALQAGLDAETALTNAGYGLFGTNAKDWAEMTFRNDNAFNKEALMVFLLSSTSTTSQGYNNGWENSLRLRDQNGTGGIAVPKAMLDLFPLADGSRPTASNYIDTFFFENRDPRFYRTFAFSGTKWGYKQSANASVWLYRWRENTSAPKYYGNNQTNSPAVVRKMSNPAADNTGYAFSGTDIFEYRYAELLLNIAEAYAATGNAAKAIEYIGKVRARVGIPATNNYGLGSISSRHAAIEAVLYERRVELAYEGKRFWDLQRWMLYDNDPASGNSVQKLGVTPLNGVSRTGFYWQAKVSTANDPLSATDRDILVDPDASDFNTQIAKLKNLYNSKFVMTPLDQAWDRVNNVPVSILFRSNYYLSGLNGGLLSNNPWLLQTKGWLDFSGGQGTFDYQD